MDEDAKTNKVTYRKIESVTENTSFLSYALYFACIVLGAYTSVFNGALTIKLGDFGNISVTLFTIMSYVACKVSLYIGVYGLLLTYLRKKWMSFYTYFTIITSIIFLTGLLIFVVQ